MDKTLLLELGVWLGQLRCDQDPRMSQDALGKLVGIGRETIGRMERGAYLLDEDLLYRIGAALGQTAMDMNKRLSDVQYVRRRQALAREVVAHNPDVELAIASLDPDTVYSPEAIAVLNRAVVAMTRLSRQAAS